MAHPLSKALAELVARGFDGRHRWHPPLLELVEHLNVEQALWRPAPDRKCIWDIVRHMVFWRQYLLARVKGHSVPDWRDNNWTLPSEPNEEAWRSDLELLRQVQTELVDWFAARRSDQLLAAAEDGNYEQFALEAGIIGHDSYHTGQIAVLRALMGLSPPDNT